MAREKTCVGIDIGASSVKICQLKNVRNVWSIEHFGMIPLPSETVVDGALMNAGRIVDAISNWFAERRIRQRQVAISVSGAAVIIKKINLPKMTRVELERSIIDESQQFLPYDINEVFLDLQILPTVAQQGTMDVLLVAAKKDFINEYTSVVLEAGLEPVVCDVDAFAMATSFEQSYDMEADKTYALVNVGLSKTNINILAAGQSVFTRDLNKGGQSFTEELQRSMGLAQEDAEVLKCNLATPDKVDAQLAGQAKQAMIEAVHDWAGDVQRSLDYFASASAEPPPSMIYMAGGSARLQMLCDILADRAACPVSPMDPFRRLGILDRDKPQVLQAGPSGAVAVGLASRFSGDT